MLSYFLKHAYVFLRYNKTYKIPVRSLRTTNYLCFNPNIKHEEADNERMTKLATLDYYFNHEKKDKETFLALIDYFNKKKYKTGHIEFIYAALNRMEEYGVNEELEVYKKLIDVMPKKKMVPTNEWQSESFYFPKHQHCIVDVLLKMEQNQIIPDRDMQDLLISIFGYRSLPIRRYWRMMYWAPKMKYASPWTLPKPIPKDPKELAKIGVAKMCTVDLESEIKVYRTTDDDESVKDTWIVSGQSPAQKNLLEYHPHNVPVFIEGGFKLYLRKSSIIYFILRSDPIESRKRRPLHDPDVIKNLKIPFFDQPTAEDLIPKMTVHEQRDGIIYGIAATGTSDKNSLLSWVRLLEKDGNSNLKNLSIVFRMSSPVGPISQPLEGIEGDSFKEIQEK